MRGMLAAARRGAVVRVFVFGPVLPTPIARAGAAHPNLRLGFRAGGLRLLRHEVSPKRSELQFKCRSDESYQQSLRED